MNLHRFLLAALLAAGLGLAAAAPQPAHAAGATEAALNAEQREALDQVEAYLNDVRSLRARFIQLAPDGGVAEGDFYLRRPGRLRFEYDAPVPILIVGDGFLLHYHDKELGQINEWPIFDTPIGSLSRDKVGFGDDLVVTEVATDPGRITVTVVRRDDPGEGSLTLFFTRDPMRFVQWRVKDAQGQVTTVVLEDLEINVQVSAELFVWNPPKGPQR
ncbi:MAG: outer membrane lipoprotein carrier protein LolA [Alphaproteobacteria bacterium]